MGIGDCAGFGLNVTSSNLTYRPSNFEILRSTIPDTPPSIRRDVASVIERCGADGFKLLAAPADADAKRQPPLR